MALKSAAVITAQWLKGSLHKTPKNIKVLDATWGYKKNGFDDYIKRHIPTAQFWDANECVVPTRHIPRALPSPECFTKYAKSQGINPDTHIIVYDQDIQLSASRTWWNFRAYGHQHISVLNGGMKKWDAEGYETESGEVNADQEGTFEASVNQTLLVTYEQMLDHVRKQTTQILDTRNRENFTGEAEEPSPATVVALQSGNFPLPAVMARGHLPGAVNVDVSSIIDKETREFKSPEQIKEALHVRGFELERPITSMCYSGLLATVYAVAAAHAAMPDMSVYYGSWTEFGQRAAEDNMIVKPEGKKQGG